MGLLRVDELEVGMTLADDLHGSNGRLLLPKGSVLEDKHLRIMKIWGVNEVRVDGVEPESLTSSLDAMDEELRRRSREYADTLFQFCDLDHPAVHELYRLAVMRAAAALLSGADSLTPDKDPYAAALAKASPDALDVELPEDPEQIVSREVSLATFPDVYQQVVHVLEDPTSTSSKVADVVGKDPGISARLIRLVNSPLYSFPSQVDSIARAITLIGARELSMLTLSITVTNYFKDVPPDFFNLERFWRHSIACGVFAKLLAARFPGLSEERFFLLGLLHDIGRIVIFKTYPKAAAKVRWIALEGPCLLHEAERSALGFDHTEVAETLMRVWDFPESLRGVVGSHHEPVYAEKPLDASVLHLADILARVFRDGYRGKVAASPLSEEAWELLGLSAADLAPMASQADHMIDDIIETFIDKN